MKSIRTTSLIRSHLLQEASMLAKITNSVCHSDIVCNMIAPTSKRYNMIKIHFLIMQYWLFTYIAPIVITFKDRCIINFLKFVLVHTRSSFTFFLVIVARMAFVPIFGSRVVPILVLCIPFFYRITVFNLILFTHDFSPFRIICSPPAIRSIVRFVETFFTARSMSIFAASIYGKIFNGLLVGASITKFRGNKNGLGILGILFTRALFAVFCVSRHSVRAYTKVFNGLLYLACWTKLCGMELNGMALLAPCGETALVSIVPMKILISSREILLTLRASPALWYSVTHSYGSPRFRSLDTKGVTSILCIAKITPSLYHKPTPQATLGGALCL